MSNIRSYIANLELRLQTIQRCIGGVQQYNEDSIKQIRSKSSEFVSKLHKDTQRKFEKVKKAIQKYGELLDMQTTSGKQKLQILSDDLEELRQVSVHLDNIQKLLPTLKTNHYMEIRDQVQNIDLLFTASDLSVGSTKNSIKVKNYDDRSLADLRNQHREQMNELLELNRRVINNINSKLEALINKEKK